MQVQRISQDDKISILEMYKSHYTAKEISDVLGCSYGTVQSHFRVFTDMKIPKHDRKILFSEDFPLKAKLSHKLSMRSFNEGHADAN